MFGFLRAAIFGCCLVMAAWPLVQCVTGRRRFSRWDRHGLIVAVCYYVLISSFVADVLLDAANLPHLGHELSLPISFFLALVGPLVALHIRAAVRDAALQRQQCLQCGYNLTGNVSGMCPECSRPLDGPLPFVAPVGIRAGLPGWRTAIPLWLLGVVLLAAAAGYRRVQENWVCSECARHETRDVHEFRLPFDGPLLWSFQGGVQSDERRDHLTPYLDPDGRCPHRWTKWRCYGESVMGHWDTRRADPSFTGLQKAPELDEFMSQHPEFVERMRGSLRRGEPIFDWLFDEYWEWTQSREQDTENLPEAPSP
ncbi:MAG: hypothetical protein JXB13_21835 [Phycisphaerae bacterium]|nr:hypothetical protein [Phycisphaerae bacterium]